MSFLNSVKNQSSKLSDPFVHWEFNNPLTEKMIDEIYNTQIDDPARYEINYDGTRAIDGGDGNFREGISDGGYALGISYIPTREVGDKSRTDVADATGREAGTYKAKAELDNVIQVYLDVPLMEVAGFQSYGKLGIQHATINTKESLNSGSTYGNEDIFGASIGLGVKGDLTYGEGLYYKGELSYTTFEDIELHNNVGNSIRAELDSYAAKFSVGKRF